MLIAFWNREADNSFIQYILRTDIWKLRTVYVHRQILMETVALVQINAVDTAEAW